MLFVVQTASRRKSSHQTHLLKYRSSGILGFGGQLCKTAAVRQVQVALTFGTEKFTMSSPPRNDRRLSGYLTASTKGVVVTIWANDTATFATLAVSFVVKFLKRVDGSRSLAAASRDLEGVHQNRSAGNVTAGIMYTH